MKTINYTVNVWATTLLISPVIFILFFIPDFGTPENWFTNTTFELFATLYVCSLFLSCMASIISLIAFLSLAYFLSARDGSIYLKKTLLILVTLIGFLPAFSFMEYKSECFILISPWLFIGTLSTFLYPWQPEND